MGEGWDGGLQGRCKEKGWGGRENKGGEEASVDGKEKAGQSKEGRLVSICTASVVSAAALFASFGLHAVL